MERFHHITSADNSRYKSWVKLTRNKFRKEWNMYLIEGAVMIKEAMRSGAVIREIIICDDGRGDLADIMPMGLTEELIAGEVPFYFLPPELFRKLSQTENGRNVMATVEKKNYGDGFPIASGRSRNAVILDRLQDPGNIGTIIRAADGAGFGSVIAIKGTADIYSSKVVRAAAGSLFRIPIVEVENLAQLMEILETMELRLVTTAMECGTEYFREDLSNGIALAIGNEGGGISEELMALSDARVMIPMHGEIESLNASVAAGIIMFESLRQRTEKGV